MSVLENQTVRFWSRQAVKFGVALFGGFCFTLMGAPSGWLMGAVAASVLWGFTRFSTPMPTWIRNGALVISGTCMGQGLTPEALEAVRLYPVSLSILLVCVVFTTVGSAVWLEKVGGWKLSDAILASLPGALNTILIVAAERSKVVGSIMLVQSFRLIALLVLLPVTITITSGAPPSGLPGAGKQVMDMMPLIVILCGGVVLGFLFEHINLSGGFLVAGLVISLTVHVMELVPGVVPQPLALVGTTVVGTFIGERFGMVEWKTVRRMLPVAAGSACIQIVIAAIIAVPGAWAAKATVMDGLLAFAPGQQEVMSLLALTLGLNPLFVVTHQLMRFLSITLTLPIWYPILADWEDRRDARRAAESAKDDSPGSGTA